MTTLRRELKVKAASALLQAGWSRSDICLAVGLFVANPARTARMAELYRSGKTLEQIGVEYGVTRERVRQVLKPLGLSRKDGGVAVRYGERWRSETELRQRRVVEAQAKRDATVLRHFGCDYATARTLNNGAPFKQPGTRAEAFFRQKRSAGQRGIDWCMTFPEWCRVWDESGKVALRGRGRGRYCMSRKGDAGPYSVGNVRIITNEENIAESYQIRPWGERFPELSRRAGKNMLAAYRMREEGKSCEEVAAILGIKKTTVPGYSLNGKRMAAEGLVE